MYSPASALASVRKWGIRNQSTAVAVVVVACALVVGGLLLLLLLQNALTSATDGVLRTKAHDVASLIASQDVTEAGQSISATGGQDLLVQIVDGSGKVVAASDPAWKTAPISSLRPARGDSAAQRVSGLRTTGEGGEYYVVAVGAQSGQNRYVVLAARSVQVQSDTLRTVGLFLLLATPVLLVVVGVAVRFLVGRSLRQVETVRSQVDRIDAGRLAGRVDVPQTKDELEALAVTMNAMLGRIEAADAKQRRFLSHASHELRSPLTTLRTGLEVAAKDPTNRQWHDLAPLLQDEARRMGFLVEDLLTLSKAEDSGFSLQRRDVDLDDVLATELQRLRATGTHDIVSSLLPVRVSGDPGRLAQVLRNVLDNAARHARHGIRATMSVEGSTAVVLIDNDGPVIPVDDRERIFDRFVRLDESRSRDGGGSGLGLAIARSLLEAHGGRIGTGQAPDGFCRFEIRLPVA
ncbi:sensor histidine kinase [Specibacter cremeus]|uniref:sensor histidine kinase n=1 Tax=Specibacter cremeus TaxID=1629051 RepID=UPI0013DDEED1|nr:HAMP domain-containing sensor histidine kinase [Specibacter cremeus]